MFHSKIRYRGVAATPSSLAFASLWSVPISRVLFSVIYIRMYIAQCLEMRQVLDLSSLVKDKVRENRRQKIDFGTVEYLQP